MKKVEKVFWYLLLFTSGVVVGAVSYAVLGESPKLETECYRNGHSIQADENGTVYDTYIPALDECSKEK